MRSQLLRFGHVRDNRLDQKSALRMSKVINRSHKYFWLDPAKITRAQKALGAKTQTETIDRALDLVISEAKSRRLTHAAHRRFLRSSVHIKDVSCRLED